MIDMRIDISWIEEMIEEMIMTMDEMIIGVMITMIQEGMTTVITTTVSIHLSGKMVTYNCTRAVTRC